MDGKGLIKDASVKGVRGVIGKLSVTEFMVKADKQIDDQCGGIHPSHFGQRTFAMQRGLEISSWIAYISRMRS